MITIPCPWCAQEVPLGDDAWDDAALRCDACATIVDLGPAPAADRSQVLPLAA